MKKLITLLLAVAGMVSTVSATKIYIQNTKKYSKLCVYMWGSSTDNESKNWPGTSLKDGSTVNVETVTVNNQTKDEEIYYEVELYDNTSFVVNDGSDNNKTADKNVSDYPDGTYCYMDGTGSGSVTLTKVNVYSYTINVSATYWATPYFYYWNANGNNGYPGVLITTGTYTFKAYTSSVGVIFNNNSDKTCDMTAVEGTNNYYICSAKNNQDNVWGEYVKTNASGYATYVCTKNLTIPANTAYYAEDLYNGSALAKPITNPAGGTAMLIKGAPNTTYHFETRSGVTTTPSKNAFKQGSGSAVASQVGGNYNYILNGDVFKAANGNNVASNKAYLQLSAPAASRVLVFDAEISGISTIRDDESGSKAYFNLSGQRVNAPVKGLYIQNGKKMIIK